MHFHDGKKNIHVLARRKITKIINRTSSSSSRSGVTNKAAANAARIAQPILSHKFGFKVKVSTDDTLYSISTHSFSRTNGRYNSPQQIN